MPPGRDNEKACNDNTYEKPASADICMKRATVEVSCAHINIRAVAPLMQTQRRNPVTDGAQRAPGSKGHASTQIATSDRINGLKRAEE